jgi:hypothetical protein
MQRHAGWLRKIVNSAKVKEPYSQPLSKRFKRMRMSDGILLPVNTSTKAPGPRM